MNMNEIIKDVIIEEIRSISPDEESKKEGIKKTVTLRVKYDGLTIGDLFKKAFKTDVVSWQNGAGGRKNFDKIKDHSVIEILAARPGSKVQEDPITAVLREAEEAGMTVEDYLKAELAKRK